MSNEAIKRAWAYHPAPELKPTERLALLSLATHADNDFVCWPSAKSIAAECGIDTRRVKHWVSALQSRGVVIVFPGSGRGNSNTYLLRLADDTELRAVLVRRFGYTPEEAVRILTGDLAPDSEHGKRAKKRKGREGLGAYRAPKARKGDGNDTLSDIAAEAQPEKGDGNDTFFALSPESKAAPPPQPPQKGDGNNTFYTFTSKKGDASVTLFTFKKGDGNDTLFEKGDGDDTFFAFAVEPLPEKGDGDDTFLPVPSPRKGDAHGKKGDGNDTLIVINNNVLVKDLRDFSTSQPRTQRTCIRDVKQPPKQRARRQAGRRAAPPGQSQISPRSRFGRLLTVAGVRSRERVALQELARQGDLTPEDFLSELARAYADPRVAHPAFAAAAVLVRGDRPAPEYRDPEVWRRYLPAPLLRFLAAEGWLTRTAAPEDMGDKQRQAPPDVGEARRQLPPDAGDEQDAPPAEMADEANSPAIPQEIRERWRVALQQLRQTMPHAVWREHIAPLRLEGFDRAATGMVLTALASGEYSREWLDARVRRVLERSLSGLLAAPVTVRFVTATAQAQRADTRAVWRTALEWIRGEISKPDYDAWVKPARPVAVRDGRLVIAVANDFARRWLDERLKRSLERRLPALAGRPMSVEFVVG